MGSRVPGNVWIGVAGLDLVRDADGEWLVLEDNVRTPSGFAYLHATRRALLEHIAVPPDAMPRPLDGEIDLLADALRAVAPESARGHRAPAARVLTDGEHNSAYWEHAWLSRQLGIPLVDSPSSRSAPTAASGCASAVSASRAGSTSSTAAPTPTALDSDIGRLLIEPIRAGNLGMVNQYGTGVADDKLTHAYVEDMIRFYVGEDPVLRSVPTYDLAQPGQLEEALDVFDSLVLKPRAGHGGVGVLIAPLSSRAEVEATRAAVIAAPGDWIAQRMVMLSTHPTVVDDGRLAPRHIDLRPFVFLGEGCKPRVLPGGLTRVARSEGAWSSTRPRTAAQKTPGSCPEGPPAAPRWPPPRTIVGPHRPSARTARRRPPRPPARSAGRAVSALPRVSASGDGDQTGAPMSRGPLRGDGLRPPVLTDSPLTSPAPAWLRCTDDRLAPVCPPLADHSTPGIGTVGCGRGLLCGSIMRRGAIAARVPYLASERACIPFVHSFTPLTIRTGTMRVTTIAPPCAPARHADHRHESRGADAAETP